MIFPVIFKHFKKKKHEQDEKHEAYKQHLKLYDDLLIDSRPAITVDDSPDELFLKFRLRNMRIDFDSVSCIRTNLRSWGITEPLPKKKEGRLAWIKKRILPILLEKQKEMRR